MKLYVASSWRNPIQPRIVKLLRYHSHEVYDFRQPHLGPGAGGTGFAWSEIDPAWEQWTAGQYAQALHHPLAELGLASDKAGLDWAEGGVFVAPAGCSASLELGYLIGQGKACWVLCYDGAMEPDLMFGLAAGGVVTTDVELVDSIKRFDWSLRDPLAKGPDADPDRTIESQLMAERAIRKTYIESAIQGLDRIADEAATMANTYRDAIVHWDREEPES